MKKFVGIILLFIAISCTTSGLQKDDTVNPYIKNIIGSYTEERLSYVYYHYFLNDGCGYSTYTRGDGGVYRHSFSWGVNEEDMLNVVYDEDDVYVDINRSYKVEIDTNGDMRLTDVKDNSVVLYKKFNNNGTTSVDYKSVPFPCYVRIYGYYYELTKAVMRCSHAISTEANSKHLQFFGSNGLLSPTGVRFMYFTPYYEGIDKEWSDGTYVLNKDSSYWVYGGADIRGGSESGRCSGKLTIKTVGKMKFFDFSLNGGDAVGHFEGIWGYE